jgi:hypothetical protein
MFLTLLNCLERVLLMARCVLYAEEETVKNASDEEAEMERLLGKGKPAETADPQPLVREEQPAPAVARPWDKHKEKHGK